MFLSDPTRAHPVIRAARTGVSLLLCLQLSSVFTLTLEARSFVGGAMPVSGDSASDGDTSLAGASSSSAAVAQQLRAQQQSLVRSVQVLHAMQQAQAAARAAAQQVQTNVPNGLGAGGLQVANGVPLDPRLWQGAAGPVQTSGQGGRLVVKIDQTTQKAILTWDSFNVGRETDLVFNQKGNADWVALNRVTDAQAKPSQILGTIKADGSVYVLNNNGVIFGGASQVNVHNLVAAAANLSNEQFLNQGIYSTRSGANYVPSFTDAGGKIVVAAGAQLTTQKPTSATQGGGFVMLLGTEVTNEGTIATPKGQAALAAGDDFIVRRGFGTAENQYSTTRGNEVRGLIDAGSAAGTVVNSGLIEATEGDITLAGRTIRQNGVAMATTSVNQRGTIHLLNSASDGAGSVTVGQGWEIKDVNGKVVGTGNSLTAILPELDSKDKALDGQRDTLIKQSETANSARQGTTNGGFDDRSLLADRQDQSRVEIVTGGNVVFEKNSLTMAQGGQVAVQANKGRITVANGATIDVSGVRGVALDAAANAIKINIQGNELRDSPANREKDWLKNQNVWVDVRDLIYVPSGTGGYEGSRWYTAGGLLEVGGYLANTAHTIGEWTAVGGTITLAANEVVAHKGAVFDLSGGSLDYAAGSTTVTRLLGSDGKLYEVGKAPVGMTFVGLGNAYIDKSEKWGVTSVYSNPLTNQANVQREEQGYTVGRDAGKLILSTPTAVFEGTIDASVVAGARQTNTPASGGEGYKQSQYAAPRAGSLAIGKYDAFGRAGGYGSGVVIGNIAGITEGMNATDALARAANTVWLDAQHLNSQKLGGLSVLTTDSIAVDAPLTLADGGKVELIAPIVDINADITARGGSLIATNVFTLDNAADLVVRRLLKGGKSAITLGTGVTLDLRGLWVNLQGDPAAAAKLAWLNGGSATLSSTHDVTLKSGSLIDVSSGAAILATGNTKGGRGGNVTLIADYEFSGLTAEGLLTLDGKIAGFGVNGGGTLKVESGQTIVIGGQATQTEGVLAAGEASLVSLVLAEDLKIGADEVFSYDTYLSIRKIVGGGTLSTALTPMISSTAPLTLGADYVVPEGCTLRAGANFYSGGQTAPKGAVVFSWGGSLPAGYVVPADVFPNGLPIPTKTIFLPAGTSLGMDHTFAAGTILPAGIRLPSPAVVRPSLNLDPTLFKTGFANYSVSDHKGLAVAEGVTVDVTMPVYRFNTASLRAATGSDPAAALELWTPPLHLEDSANGRLTQRAGASLSLSVGQVAGDSGSAALVIGKGSTLSVDPGQTINLSGSGVGQMMIDGTLNAWGGAIKVKGVPFDDDGSPIWIGKNAVLDVAGRAFTALDSRGRRYGRVLNGGAITIDAGRMFVVVRDGALLDASGVVATIDLLSGGATEVASNGGAISFGSTNGFDLGGTWHAKAGGAGAAGGTLAINLTNAFYEDKAHPGNRPRELIVTQIAPESSLAADAAPGSAANGLAYGHGVIGVDQIMAGGFDNLNLLSGNIITFDGDVSLTMSQRLQLDATALALTDSAKDDTRVVLSAPYVRLSGGSLATTSSARQTAARFSVTAALLDVERSVQFGLNGARLETPGLRFDRRGFAEVELQSSGDIRFLPSGGLNSTFLQTRGDLVLAAQQIYPATGASAIVRAGYLAGFGSEPNPYYDPAYSLTIRGIGQAPVAQPFSAFGALTLGAYTINQGGVVRAPLGSITLGNETGANTINLLPGSITSTSSKGLVMPYGGTVDGIDWLYADKKIALFSGTGGVSLASVRVDVQKGAMIDLSGGGDLTGAGFVSGRGGSVDTLRHPLIEANPGYGMSASGNSVYAIVPSQASGYAPVSPDAGAGDPLVGQQITLDGSIPGLPAGTYTLMPSTYALLPGAFRVEMAAKPDPRGLPGWAAMPDGSYVAGARLGVANTSIRDSLARQVILTPAKVARTYSLYNETNYSDYVLADAARRSLPRAMQPLDGKNLNLTLRPGAGTNAFRFDGAVDFSAGKGGYAGSASLLNNSTGGEIEILAAGAAATEGFGGVSVYADALNALSAKRLTIGARPNVTYGQQGRYVQFWNTSDSFSITLREGAVLRAAEVFLVAGWRRPTGETGAITIEAGAGISTLGMGEVPFDSTDGFIYAPDMMAYNGVSMLSVSNGRLDVLPPDPAKSPGAAILIGVCGASGNCNAPTTLYSEGTIGFATTNRFELGDNVRYGTRNLALGVGAVNVGSSEALAAAGAAGVLPSGLTLNQAVLDRLLRGDTSTGAPALESLILNAREAVNFFGTATLDTYDAAGKSRIANLVFGTPAIYGSGGSGDVATIRTENLVWSGNTGGPGSVITGGAGTGSGSLVIDAERITFGYGPNVQIRGVDDAGRLALGFASVNLNASDRITANHKGSLAVYQSQGAYVPGAGYSYSGGALNISTPLLTGEAGSVNRITAGGAIRVTAPQGASAGEVIGAKGLGAELALNGASVSIATAVTLPSGRLTVSATGDITLSDAARIDMAGREVPFDDIKKYSWGGEVILESRDGDIRQAAGSTIDLSAKNNHAGRLTAVALGAGAGTVDLQGRILGATSGQYAADGTIVPYRGGFIDVRAQRLGGGGTLSDQFAALNARLNAGEVFGGRGFQLKQGDLVIGDGVRAGDVNVSLDGGHLTVTGTIDASGAEVGSIRLAAKDGLTIAGSAVLDAHGERLRVDSYGKIIDSPNRAIVELSSGQGLLTLASGARIDLRHGTGVTVGTAPGQYDGVLRGSLELNAPRLDADDIAIDASGSLTIQGARSIAVNAVRAYSGAEVPVGTETTASGRPYQFIDQDWLNDRHGESNTFINAALGNAALMNSKLAGLNNAAYRDAFHLRPLVEVRTEGDLVVKGDLDLSGHRYDGVNPNFPHHPSVYGSGEVGVLTLRAGGNLDIYGSINDGFAPSETPDDDGWILRPGKVSFGGDVIVPNGSVTLADGTTYISGRTLNYDLPVKALTVPEGTRLPAAAVLNGAVFLPANTILAGDVYAAADGSLLYAAGTRLAQAVTLPAGTRLGAGFVAPAALSLKAMVWPKGVALPNAAQAMTLDGDLTLPMGGLIPSQTVVKLPNGALSVRLRPADANGRQGANWAVASMLPAGSQSWSMRLLAGADTAAADSRMLRPRDATGNLTLADSHYSVFDKYQKIIIPGTPAQPERPGGAWYWTDLGAADWGTEAGTQISIDYGPDYICADLPGWCVRYLHTITAKAVEELGLDTEAGWKSWELPGPMKAGDPVPVVDYDSWICGEAGYCVSLGEPIPAIPGTPDQVVVGDLLGYIPLNPIFSVIRTGTGDLDLVASGNLAQRSPYGVYTAGTQSQGVTAAFDQPRALSRDGKVLGNEGADYESLVSGDDRLSHAWYPTGGGNLLLRAGGNLTGDLWQSGGYSEEMRNGSKLNADPTNWLWRQGHAPGSDAGAAWWINFGSYVRSDDAIYGGFEYDSLPYLVGFTGFGTLGGGDLTVEIGGNAGAIDRIVEANPRPFRSQGLVLAVGSTGRVNAQGDLVLTGGGDLDVRIGGSLNPNLLATATDLIINGSAQFLTGVIANLRGNSSVSAASIGNIRLNYGAHINAQNPREVRPFDPFTATQAGMFGGPTLLPGDATFALTTRGDLVVGGVIDVTRRETIDPDPNTPAAPWFSLWSDRTAIDLFTAGGNLTPGNAKMQRTGGVVDLSYPSILRAVAPSGSIYAAPYEAGKMILAPSPNGEFEWLAGQSIYGGVVSRSSADPAVLTTPFRPATLASLDPKAFRYDNNLFAFGPNSASGLYTLDPARFYALGGDIVGLMTGELQAELGSSGKPALYGLTLYSGGGAVWMKAGRDIINSGHNLGESELISGMSSHTTSNLFVHTAETEVSIVSAGRDIVYSSFTVAGPGALEISAGRNILMDDRASVTSLGAYIPGDTRPGASIAIAAGMGNGVDWTAIRTRYLDPAKLADPKLPLADQPGLAVKVYTKELSDWLGERYGFKGTTAEALAYFDALAPEQQRVFLRQVYFAEIREGGREYNDPVSSRFASYLRGREMIATLFPDKDKDGKTITRTGDIIMFGGSGVRTNFGGDIEMMAPGGQIVVGVQGVVPPATAGIITQGQGDIRLFSEKSLLLGLSRIMTTFGGSIFAWSEEGDINAGRGAKTTVLYTPPLRTYDNYGNVTLASQVPSSGAGIATLNPIPEVPPGDIDLIAPLGTIDAGEAGIRVSGNINLAALHIVNAANIQVQGTATGIPTVTAPNVGAITAAANTTGAVANAAMEATSRSNQPLAVQAMPTLFKVEMIGYGPEAPPPADEEQTQASLPSGREPVASEKTATAGVPVAAVLMGR